MESLSSPILLPGRFASPCDHSGRKRPALAGGGLGDASVVVEAPAPVVTRRWRRGDRGGRALLIGIAAERAQNGAGVVGTRRPEERREAVEIDPPAAGAVVERAVAPGLVAVVAARDQLVFGLDDAAGAV